MKDEFIKFCESLESSIQQAYESNTTMEEAEKLAAKFLHAQLMTAERLRAADLNARMRKAGTKAIRSAIYLQEASKGEKKPTEATLAALVEMNELVSKEQESFDTAEVDAEKLKNYLKIFDAAHVYFRSIMKVGY